jgi:hypothetical protein
LKESGFQEVARKFFPGAFLLSFELQAPARAGDVRRFFTRDPVPDLAQRQSFPKSKTKAL